MKKAIIENIKVGDFVRLADPYCSGSIWIITEVTPIIRRGYFPDTGKFHAKGIFLFRGLVYQASRKYTPIAQDIKDWVPVFKINKSDAYNELVDRHMVSSYAEIMSTEKISFHESYRFFENPHFTARKYGYIDIDEITKLYINGKESYFLSANAKYNEDLRRLEKLHKTQRPNYHPHLDFFACAGIGVVIFTILAFCL